MDMIVPISEARSRLSELIEKAAHVGKHLIITRNGKAQAVIISPEEMETLEIKADRELLRSILRAREDVREGRFYSHEQLFKDV